MRALLPSVYRYSNQYDVRLLLHAVGAPHEYALLENYIIGVVVNGGIYPMWSRRRHQVIVKYNNGRNVIMTPELHALFDRHFTPFIQRP